MRIAFCDLEGTLVEGTAWNKIKTCFGAKELSDEYDKLYSEGKVGFEEWRRKLAEIWRTNKARREDFVAELGDFVLMPGARELINGLKDKGFRVVVVTGAISVFAELIQSELGIDEIHSGHEFLFDEDGYFVDINTHPEYGRGEGKMYFIDKVIKENNTSKEKCIAIGGDDINDYWMMKELKSFAVNPEIGKIKEVVNHDVESLQEILRFVG